MAFKTPQGTWRVHARSNGKRISKTFRTQILARKFEAQILAGHDLTPLDPKPREESVVTFGEFADRWLRQHSAVSKAETSQVGDRRIVGSYLKPAFGGKALTEISKSDLLDLKASLKVRMDEGTLKPATANKVVVTAKSIFRMAILWDVVKAYPWDRISGFTIPDQPFDFWRAHEMLAFYQGARFIDSELGDMALLAFNTGLRLGELRGLRWSAIDMDDREITVSASIPTNTTKLVERTKTGALGRVPLSPPALALLKRRSAKSYQGMVFDPAYPEHVCLRFQRISRRLGLKSIRFHDLRHSFATDLRRRKVDIETVQRLMRHKTLAMTMRYAHVGEDELHSAVAKLTGTDLAPIKISKLPNIQDDNGN